MMSFYNGRLKFWCQKVLPLVYDDSLSYYEVLCKVITYLNNMADDVREIEEMISGANFQEMVNEAVTEILTESEIYNQFQRFITEVASSDNTLHNLIAGNAPISSPFAIEDTIAISSEDHIAFPSIALVNDALNVYYRSGDSHASYDGVIKHVTIDFDTRETETVATYSLTGWDLRDPHVANGGTHIYCLARSSTNGNKTVVIDTSNGTISDVTFDGEKGYMIGGAVFKFNSYNYFIVYTSRKAFLAKQTSGENYTTYNIIKDFGNGYNEGSICPASNGFLVVLRNSTPTEPGLVLFSNSIDGEYTGYDLPFNPEGPELFRAVNCTFLSYRNRNRDQNQDYSNAELVIQSMNAQYLGSTKYKYLRNVDYDCGYANFCQDSTYLYITFYVATSKKVYIAKMRNNNLLQENPSLVINKSVVIEPGQHTYTLDVHGNLSPIADASVVCGAANVLTSIRTISQSMISVNANNLTQEDVTATISVRTSNVNTNLTPATWATIAG